MSSKSFIILLCFLAFHTVGAQGTADGQVAADSMVSKKVDFVHETSIFDVCFPVFRSLYASDYQYAPFERLIYLEEYLPRSPIKTYSYGWTDKGIDFETERLRWRNVKYLRVYRQTMLRDTAYDEAAAKALLVSEMEEFRDTAAYLPTLYAVIEEKYGGDVACYVDHLYRRAILTGRGARLRFRMNPSKRRMRRDPGLQFVLSRMMYRLWETLGRPEPPVADGTRLVISRSELEQMAGGEAEGKK